MKNCFSGPGSTICQWQREVGSRALCEGFCFPTHVHETALIRRSIAVSCIEPKTDASKMRISELAGVLSYIANTGADAEDMVNTPLKWI